MIRSTVPHRSVARMRTLRTLRGGICSAGVHMATARRSHARGYASGLAPAFGCATTVFLCIGQHSYARWHPYARAAVGAGTFVWLAAGRGHNGWVDADQSAIASQCDDSDGGSRQERRCNVRLPNALDRDVITSATFTVPDFGLALPLTLTVWRLEVERSLPEIAAAPRLSFSPSTLSLAESLSGDGGCRHSLNASRGPSSSSSCTPS